MARGTQPGSKAKGTGARQRLLKGGTVVIMVGLVAGAALGYGYYRLVGCSTGACPITSNPWIATLYGALVGAVASMAITG